MTFASKIWLAAPFHHLESSLASSVRHLGAGDPLRPRRVIVISNRLRDHVQKILARAGGFAGVSVLTMAALAREITEPERASGGLKEVLPPFAEVLAEKTLEGARSGLAHFRSASKGCGRSLYATLTDLAEANLSPGLVRKFGWKMSGPDAGRCEDLARLAERFWRWMRDLRCYDGSSLLLMASERAEAEPPRIPTIVYGFAEMNALQRRLIAAVCRETQSQALIPAQIGAPACAHAEPLIRWFEGLGFRRENAGTFAPRPLSGVANALFSHDKQARFPETALRILKAPSRGREAWEVCREIIKARESMPNDDEVCILMTEKGHYQNLFKEMFESLDIPCCEEERRPLAASIAGRLFLLTLRVVLDDYPRASVMRLLDEGDFVGSEKFSEMGRKYQFEELAGSSVLASQWEFFSRRLPYLKGPDEWLSALDSALDDMRGEDEEHLIAYSLAISMSDFFALFEKIPERGTPSSFVDSVLEVFCGLTNGLAGQDEVARTISALSDLDEILPEMTLAEFHVLCERALEAANLKENGAAHLVNLSSVLGARGLSFDTVVLSGMAEGSFPSPGVEDPFLPDALREKMNRVARDASPDQRADLPPKKSRESEARFQFWTVLQSVRNRLILSTPSAENDSMDEAAFFPSAFFHDLAEVFEEPKDGVAHFITRSPLSRIAPAILKREDISANPLDLREYDIARILARIHGEAPDTGSLRYLGLHPGFARRRDALAERWKRGVLTAHDGTFSGSELHEIICRKVHSPSRPMGVTSLNTFFECPYRFINAQLHPRVKKREEPKPPFSADAKFAGQLTHAVLEALHRWLQETNQSLNAHDEASIRAALREQIRKVMEKEAQNSEAPPLLALSWRIFEGALYRRLWGYVEHKRAEGMAWCPVRIEERFGDRGSEPLRISLEGGGLLLSGRIDLLEQNGGGGYRVVDFKTVRGKDRVPSERKVLDGGARLQVHLYARRETEILPEGSRVGGSYVYVTEGEGVVQRAYEDIEEREKDVDALLRYFLSCVKSGSFFPTPGQHCDHCDYKALCGPDRAERARSKEEAPERIELQQLRGAIP